MTKFRKFGLIGFPLKHSFSPGYFSEKFEQEKISDAEYKLYPLSKIQEFDQIDLDSFSGLNVTIPYKRSILPFLDEIDESAQVIGAVNTISFHNGIKKGYNTDVFGFEKSLLSWFGKIDGYPNRALILGRGGASQAVKYVLRKLRIRFQVVSRRNKRWNYDNLSIEDVKKHLLIINTTPLGMAPAIQSYPDIPYEGIGPDHFLFDLVYNPEKSVFLDKGLKRGARVKNGLEMLYLQAEKAWEIWNKEK